ncbi:MAG: alpha/beta hydrolase [Sphingobium sp.]|nr:MAG: alpha/beta hydrolase [Sphingobium sp.]
MIGRMVAGGVALGLGVASAPARATAFASRRIAVTVRGSGPDVLMIPGLASGPGIWNGAVAAVPGYRYHLIQVRGFAGLAPDANAAGALLQPLMTDIVRYAATAGLVRPAVVGHSMGGTLAMMAALRGMVGRVMVVDMLPAGAGMVGGTTSGMGYLADQLGQFVTGTKAGREMFADMLARQPGAQGSDPDVIARALTELAHTDLAPQLPRMAVPMRIVYAVPGDADGRAAAIQRYRAAYAGVRTASLLPIGPSGHMVMADQPAAFAQALRTFLKPS